MGPLLRRADGGQLGSDKHVELGSDEFSHNARNLVRVAFDIAIIDDNIFTLDVAVLS